MAQEMLLSQIREHKSIFLILVCFLVFTMEARAISNIDYFEFINDLKSFSASFKQYTYNENGSLIKESNGSIIYKKKSKYILEYIRPNKIKFISDGQFLTTYDEDLEQIIIQSSNKLSNQNIVDIMTDENLIKKKFNIKTYTLDNENHFKFTPKNGKVKRNVFLLVIIDGKISRISFMNDFDQSVTMNLSNFKKNEHFLDILFKTKYPENFDVIIDK